MPARSRGSAAQTVFAVVPGRSAVLLKARSNVGPIAFATSEARGEIECTFDGSRIVVDPEGPQVRGTLAISLRALTSGNPLYDTELARRIDGRRHPDARVELERVAPGTGAGRYLAAGRVEIHDVSRPIEGSITVEVHGVGSAGGPVLVARGQHVLDIREFGLEVPATLALKIRPEISLELYLEARPR